MISCRAIRRDFAAGGDARVGGYGGAFLSMGLVQVAGIASACAIVFLHGSLLLVPCVAGWGWSVHHYGKGIDQGAAWLETSASRRRSIGRAE